MSHVFISYAHDDRAFVTTVLIPQLREANIPAWIDSEELRGGEDWRRGIDQAIENAFALLLIMSPQAKSSEYVTYEWAFAIGAKKVVIPLLIQKTDLHPRLEALQYFRFIESENISWPKLIERLKEVQQDSKRDKLEIPHGADARVETAIAELNKSLTISERKNAIDLLANTTDPTAREVLMQALQIPRLQDIEVQLHIAFTLARQNELRIVPVLLNVFRDDQNENWFRETCRALSTLGNQVIPPLVEAVQGRTNSQTVRRAVLRVFQQIATPEIEPVLIGLLHDGDATIRAEAASTLGQIRAVRAVAPLIDLLSDRASVNSMWGREASPYGVVNEWVAAALRRIGTPEALAGLVAWEKASGS